nr:hypothetical protein [Candidatus Woesearchaeota archaeon]
MDLATYPLRVFEIELETQYPRIASYLSGYLNGLYDSDVIKYFHKEEFTENNKYRWKIAVNGESILHERLPFLIEPIENINQEFISHISSSLNSLLKVDYSKDRDYTLKINEFKLKIPSASSIEDILGKGSISNPTLSFNF